MSNQPIYQRISNTVILCISLFLFTNGISPSYLENSSFPDEPAIAEIPANLPADLPAIDVYGYDWDTEDVHPYKKNPYTLDDTVKLTIQPADHCPFTIPHVGKVTSRFGWRRYRMHYGIDVDLYKYDKVHSAFDGVVRIAKYVGGYGYTVVVRHYNGLETLYAHLSRIKVKPGEKVNSGHVIGLGGSTGRSSGSHLHFEVRYKGWAINPETIISFEHKELARNRIEFQPSYSNTLTEISETEFHLVREGETIYRIGQKYKVPYKAIIKLNHLASAGAVYPGQVLRIR